MPNTVLFPATPEGAASSGGALARFRAEFPAAPAAAQWDVVTGPGMTLTPGQTAQGSVLAVAMGTTANAVTSLTSTQVFTSPVKAAASIQLSQKIINQSVFFELVGCNADGSVLDEAHIVAWAFTGNDNLTATNASYESQNAGAARLRAANVATGTYVGAIGATAPVTTFELEHLVDETGFHVRTSDSTAARGNSYVRSTTVPDSPFYKVRLRFVNGATAPASATTAYVGHVSADAFAETPVEVTGSRGGTTPGSALPVAVANVPTVNVSASQVIALNANGVQTPPSSIRFDAVVAAAQTVKGSANAKLYWATITNPTAAFAALHFYNATAPTVGTTTPTLSIGVLAGDTVILPMGGIPYLSAATALTIAATTTITTAGAVAPATGLGVTVGFL